MSIPNIMNTGKTGMIASKMSIATTGHNIANANTDGYSRQRVLTSAADPATPVGKNTVGNGTHVSRVERINDEYIEKQIRDGQRDLSHFEEKDVVLRQVEDIFNEMNGEGLNRLISRFFNEFRKFSEEPESPAVKQSVREATQAMVNDFHRLRKEVEDVAHHTDSKIEGYTKEANALVSELSELNGKIRLLEITGSSPNDLLDRRDVALKKLSSLFDITMHKDSHGNYNVDIRGSGQLVSAGGFESLSIERTQADERGKPENSLDIKTTGTVPGLITHQIKGGKLGGLIEIRDRTVSTILNRLDDLAYGITESVNALHQQGVTTGGMTGICYFKPQISKDRAAEFISLSDDIKSNINNIAAALVADAPGDNRVAIAISKLQNEKILDQGTATYDEWYNSIVSGVGVASSRNRFSLNQQKDIMTQLNKMRDAISGVSIDEETTQLLQYQHAFDASAKVIQVADDLLKTVLALKN